MTFNSCKSHKKGIPLYYKNNAVVAQLVEHGLPKPRVAGSNPVYRSQIEWGEDVSPLFYVYCVLMIC